MTAQAVSAPYPLFTDRLGAPLTGGRVYVGTAGANPVTNPISVYFDGALSIPAAQPVATSGGYALNTGSPAKLFVGSTDYSVAVFDASGALVFSRLSNNQNLAIVTVDTVTGNFLSGRFEYEPNAAEIAAGVTGSITDKTKIWGDCQRFGASTAASAAVNAAAINNALLVKGQVFLTAPGSYTVDDNLDVQSNTVFTIGPGVTILGAGAKAWLDTGIVDMNARSNVTIYVYGTIDGNKANNAAGRAFGIRILDSTDIHILGNGTIQNCPGQDATGVVGGDGIYIGGAAAARIYVGALLLSGNVRQGATVARGVDITFVGTRAINITGTNPGAGFDVENDISTGLSRITFIGCSTDSCHRGFQVADATIVKFIGCTTRNNSYIDLNLVRVTDLQCQMYIGNVVPTVAQDGTVYCIGIHNASFDLQVDGNYDPQQGSCFRLAEDCSDIRIRLQARETYWYGISIGSTGMSADITDVTIEGCKFTNCVDPAANSPVIYLDGNSGSSKYPYRVLITGNHIYESRGSGSGASAGIQFSTNIPASVVATSRVHGNLISGSFPNGKGINWPLQGSVSWDPANLADGAGETSPNITVVGAAIGDAVRVYPPLNTQGMLITGYVSATDTVNVRIQNETGGAINLGGLTWFVEVMKQYEAG